MAYPSVSATINKMLQLIQGRILEADEKLARDGGDPTDLGRAQGLSEAASAIEGLWAGIELSVEEETPRQAPGVTGSSTRYMAEAVVPGLPSTAAPEVPQSRGGKAKPNTVVEYDDWKRLTGNARKAASVLTGQVGQVMVDPQGDEALRDLLAVIEKIESQ